VTYLNDRKGDSCDPKETRKGPSVPGIIIINFLFSIFFGGIFFIFFVLFVPGIINNVYSVPGCSIFDVKSWLEFSEREEKKLTL
jgi:hypothetical protein